MKKTLALMIAVFLLSALSAQNVVNSTLTLDINHVTALRAACNGASNDGYMPLWSNEIREGDESGQFPFAPTVTWPHEGMNTHSTYRNHAFSGILMADSLAAAANRLLVYQFMFDPMADQYLQVWHDTEDDIWDEYYEHGGGQYLQYAVTLYHSYLLTDYTMMVDCLWDMPASEATLHGSQQAFREDLFRNLTVLTEFVYRVLQDTPPNSSSTLGGASNAENALGISIDYRAHNLQTYTANGRLRLGGALGYAGCILEQMRQELYPTDPAYLFTQDYIARADSDLFSVLIADGTPAEANGFLEYNIQNSGVYQEGHGYTNYVLNAINPYFTARKRLDGVDYFNDPMIIDLYRETLKLVTPVFSQYSGDTSYFHPDVNTGEVVYIQGFPELINFYYQSPTALSEMQNDIAFYIDGIISIRTNPAYYANPFFCYNPDRELILDSATVPQYLNHGSWSNQEFTVMQQRSNSLMEARDRLSLAINHENSYTNYGHEDSDQSSFILFFKGRPILIDPGYRPTNHNYWYGKAWLASPYAHNLILANPSHGQGSNQNEENTIESLALDNYVDDRTNDDRWRGEVDTGNGFLLHLPHLEPVGLSADWPSLLDGTYSAETKNPAFKTDEYYRDNIEHVLVQCVYDHPQGTAGYPSDNVSDILTVNRNFYLLNKDSDAPCVAIFDYMESSNHSVANVLANQLHFSTTTVDLATHVMDDDLTYSTANGTFLYEDCGFANTVYGNGDIHYLHGAMGSVEDALLEGTANLPQGLFIASHSNTNPLDSTPLQEHRMLRLTTGDEPGDVSFLTVLLPSQSDTDPITQVIQNSNGSEQRYYGVNYQQAVNHSIYISIARPDENNDYPDLTFTDTAVRFSTDADLSIVDLVDHDEVNYFTLRNASHFEIQDPQVNPPLFADYLVLEAEDIIQDITISYGNDSLDVMIFIPDEDHPQFKVARQGVEAAYVRIRKRTATSYSDGTLDIVIGDPVDSFAYDNEYFYINYEWDDLPHTDDLVLCKGTYPVFDLTHNLCVDGNVTFEATEVNSLQIRPGCTLTVQPGSYLHFDEEVQLSVGGQLIASSEDELITFSRAVAVLGFWDGINLKPEASAVIEGCNIQYADLAISTHGILEFSNNEITQCNNGIRTLNGEFAIADNYIHNAEGQAGYSAGIGIEIAGGELIEDQFGGEFDGISGNEICGFDVGIQCQQSCIQLIYNNVYGNTVSGIRLQQNSSPRIQYCYVGENRYSTEMDAPEIFLISGSFPELNRYNDIIFALAEDCWSIYNVNEEYEDMKYLENNWWGEDVSEDDVQDSFYPNGWEPIIIPMSEESNTGFEPPSGGTFPDRSYFNGYALEEDGDLTSASVAYMQAISETPDSLEALWSLNRLLHCVGDTIGVNLYTLQAYYGTIAADTLAYPSLHEAAQLNYIYCNRMAEQYQIAIDDYLVLLDEAETLIDTLMTQLDIINTYEQSNGGGGGGRAAVSVVNSPYITITSLAEAEKLRRDIYAQLKELSSASRVFAPVYTTPQVRQNYPNPFNPETTIRFTLPRDVHVELAVYNIRGQRVRTLANEDMIRGYHAVKWDGRDSNGSSVASGVYFYRLSTGSWSTVKKMLLLK
ncbi:MAG: right-handed parallel beta-helix repeat-containing protein [Candidatus Cloacimonetes bacterium]|nr:right-handed parallel beta-helix repeat-containing protein [Candidatus Cloacimonadota bacterium]